MPGLFSRVLHVLVLPLRNGRYIDSVKQTTYTQQEEFEASKRQALVSMSELQKEELKERLRIKQLVAEVRINMMQRT